MPSALNSSTQPTLLTLSQPSLLTRLNLTVNVYVPLQSLKVLVVKVSHISLVLKNLSHIISKFPFLNELYPYVPLT
jgi:hypothetical protein